MNRILSWFSCGAASAVATKLAIDDRNYGDRVIPITCDTTESEHPDNKRFRSECEKWFGRKIVEIKSKDYNTVDEVFEARRYLAGIAGAPCTTELKKKPRQDFSTFDDYHIFGFTCDETARIGSFELRNPDLNLIWILRDNRISKQACFKRLIQAGIALPKMYSLGFKNNNCPGCVKASSPKYWNLVRQHFPEVFQRRCEQSRKYGAKLTRVNGVRIYLDELDLYCEEDFFEELSCGPECASK